LRRVLEIPAGRITPSDEAVLRQQGVPAGVPGQERPLEIARAALAELPGQLPARAVLQPVTGERFTSIYQGQGRNDLRTVVGEIFPRAGAMYLFAATIGPGVVHRIGQLFAAGDCPLAMALDAAASLAADLAAAYLEEEIGRQHPDLAALRYSPGYCGWHVSGQGALFAELQPADIGLGLTESFVMDPVKSVSGVIVVGAPEIHHFKPDYDFCRGCTERTCRDRMAALQELDQE
jgi:hypothetical protein